MSRMLANSEHSDERAYSLLDNLPAYRRTPHSGMALYCRDRRNRRLYIPEWLESSGRTAAALATHINVKPPYVSELLRGEKPVSNLDRAYDIADFLGVTIDDLYRPPPSDDQLSAVSQLSPATRSRLLEQSRKAKRR